MGKERFRSTRELLVEGDSRGIDMRSGGFFFLFLRAMGATGFQTARGQGPL